MFFSVRDAESFPVSRPAHPTRGKKTPPCALPAWVRLRAGSTQEEMMPAKSGRSILSRVTIGFAVIIARPRLAEPLRLPHLLHGEDADFRWGRVRFRTFVLTGIWGWVQFTIRRLLRRLHELEEFLRVCSWCRRLGLQGRWLTMEEFFRLAPRHRNPARHLPRMRGQTVRRPPQRDAGAAGRLSALRPRAGGENGRHRPAPPARGCTRPTGRAAGFPRPWRPRPGGPRRDRPRPGTRAGCDRRVRARGSP